MVGTQAHGGIDRLHRAYTFVERIDRLVDHRQQDAIDDEGGEILRHGHGLTEFLGQLADGGEGFLVGRHRQARDGDGGGVGGDHRLRLQHRAELFQYLALDFLVLDGGLDDEVAIVEQVIVLAGDDPGQRRLALGVGDHAALDLPTHVLVDVLLRLVDLIDIDIDEFHVVAVEGRDMGNAVAHLPGADDADGANHGGASAPRAYLLSSLVISGTAWNRSATRP